MTLLGNVLWFVFGGGFVGWIAWMCGGVLLAISIIGLPFAFAAFRIAGFVAFPFGRQLVAVRELGESPMVGTGVANLVWIVFAGLWLFLAHVAAGIACCLTLIGIPFGLAHFKLAMVSFAPLGKRVIST